ncbi:MAG: hypothetical protein IEMM0002_1180 [bacterium]|nr:MAG: hypothetical protein IEMM0002_1180 [bacterium]
MKISDSAAAVAELEKKNRQLAEMNQVNNAINKISSAIHTGATFDEIFEIIFDQLKTVIPYNRIGLSTLDESGENLTVIKAKSDKPTSLGKGYSCGFRRTSLLKVLEARKIRVISNLKEYVERTGRKTDYNEKLLKEGVRSSLTIPLFVAGRPTGFLFFSSLKPNAYTKESMGDHYEFFRKFVDSMQDHIAVALEKGMAITRLQETNAKLKELSALKDEFLSIVSHDLRSPLTAIIGFGRMLTRDRNNPLNEKQGKSVKIILRSAEHLLILLNDVMGVATMNSGRMELNLAKVRISGVLKESITAMSFNAKSRNIKIKHESKCTNLEIMADKSKMFQLFNNLIGNGIKFSPEGKTLVIGECCSADVYRFEITDNGPGIDEKYHEAIFEKFVQLGKIKSKKRSGTGLGLSICKMITDLHGGTIGVNSEPGEGSTFYFDIPAKPLENTG